VLHADVVVSAAGTSAWELLCLGAPTALVRVADNQRAGYDAVVRSGAARGLGAVEDLARDPAARAGLTRLLTDAQLRADLRARARSTVDGDGRRRVVDSALSALSLEGVLHGPEAR
jgi:spore coat polysaccharide biosynthesis predicted glycosyltransferase SpsG